nr:ribonuclease H-like domain-containing protein [Tanacetum cinerariifolium]
LELLEEKLSQEDVNQMLLRSLSPEWNTHVVVWRNKADLDTMSMDDLYNNLKVYEPEVKEIQPNSPQLVHGDLEQIHPDNMEEMDLRWQMAMLTMRARMSDQAEEGPNYALMAYSSSSSDSDISNDSTCSKSCLETVKLLKSQNNQLLKDLKKSKLMVLGYKTGLESMKEKLEFYKTNKSIYLYDIKGLNFEIQIGEITIRELKKKLEMAQKVKDDIQLNVDKFEHASKSLNKLIECQIVDKCKKGLGCENYNAVLPPYTGNLIPSTPDLSFTGLDEFVNKLLVENCKAKSSEEEPKFADTHNMVTFLSKPTESDGFEQIVDFLNAHPVRRDLRLADEKGIDCLLNYTIFEQIALMGLEVEQDSGNITKTQSKATPNEPSSQGTNSGGGPKCQEILGDAIAQTSLKLDELMALCTALQNKVLNLEKTTTTQRNEIANLKRMVKKLEKRNRKRINAIDADEDITLVSVQDEVVTNDVDKEMFDVDVLGGEEVFVADKMKMLLKK